MYLSIGRHQSYLSSQLISSVQRRKQKHNVAVPPINYIIIPTTNKCTAKRQPTEGEGTQD